MTHAPRPAPPAAAGVDAHVAREDREAVLSRLAQSVPRRWAVALLALVVALADAALDVFPARWPVLLLPPAAELSLNVWCAWRWRSGRATPRDFWAMLVIDAFGVTGMCALLGSHSVLALPALVVINAGYGLGLPRAAHVHLALAVLLYPAARVIGGALAGAPPSAAAIAVETLCLVGLARVAVASPIEFTRRLRHTRRVLGALARGDFTQRLPASERDDLGFLAGSFNRTAAALGELVEALRASEARLVVAEREARATADRMHAVAGAAAGVLGAASVDALGGVLARACAAVLPVDEFSFRVHAPGAPVPADDGGDAGAGSVLGTPIVAGGATLGSLAVRSRAADAYGGDDALVLEAIAALAATAIRNIRLVDELRRSQEALAHQAFHDPLTGLANRAGFNERLQRALGGPDAARATVVMIDLDGFKSVNDRLGHAAGDRLLAAAAERLSHATRGADTLARIGGDEFAVLLHDDRDAGAGAAEAAAARVLDALRAPFVVEGAEAWVGASIGIARNTAPRAARAPRLVDGRDGEPPEPRGAGDALLRRADAAMYAAKARGKGRFVVFEPSMLRGGARPARTGAPYAPTGTEP